MRLLHAVALSKKLRLVDSNQGRNAALMMFSRPDHIPEFNQ